MFDWPQPGCRVACLSIASVPAFAHHSFGAEYDGTKPVSLTGVITIVILVESRHVFRLIPLNEQHPDDLDPSYLGDSVGRWEGDTLAVDVTGFKERLVGSKISTDALQE